MPNGMLYLNFNPTGDLLKATRECEQDVFLQAFGNTKTQLEEEYGPYDNQSVFISVSDETGYVIGEMRIIFNGPAGLKTLNDVAGPTWNLDGARALHALGFNENRTWDIATLGVRKEYRKTALMVSLAIYHASIMAVNANDVDVSITILDDKVAALLDMIGMPWYCMPGGFSAPYLGSAASTPFYTGTAAGMERIKRENPEGYKLLIQGQGLTDIILPHPDSYLLPAYLTHRNKAA